MNRDKGSIMTAVFFSLVCSCLWASAGCAEISEGYDENTELTAMGTISEMEDGGKGPVLLRISRGPKNYMIVTAPRRYLAEEGIAFKAGEELQVTGSRYWSRDGQVYIVAKTVKRLTTGEVILLRDEGCRPMWGRGKMRRGR